MLTAREGESKMTKVCDVRRNRIKERGEHRIIQSLTYEKGERGKSLILVRECEKDDPTVSVKREECIERGMVKGGTPP